ncbi:hypothetical protein BegalDRAFT_1085 [Beggiatoa alba B18LD]|uniref:Uncharacterized protein n=1 Tax=Beggiatoa alba B18LD TaxID=395493 RepID=I3CEE5_9GAMM|nr:hypothetical protein BegalDRAFT_1085 [Beggiatoa alba B18LD]
MTNDRWLVILIGCLLIAWIVWFFWGGKRE